MGERTFSLGKRVGLGGRIPFQHLLTPAAPCRPAALEGIHLRPWFAHTTICRLFGCPNESEVPEVGLKLGAEVMVPQFHVGVVRPRTRWVHGHPAEATGMDVKQVCSSPMGSMDPHHLYEGDL